MNDIRAALARLVELEDIRERAGKINPVEPGCEKDVLMDLYRQGIRAAWRNARAALASAQSAGEWVTVPRVPTPEMLSAYLRANDAYWHRVDSEDQQPVGVWRNGTPREATAESYSAMLAVAPSAPAVASEPGQEMDDAKAWQPIETAPEGLLLTYENGLYAINWRIRNTIRQWHEGNPTNYMPLPQPPAAIAAQGTGDKT